MERWITDSQRWDRLPYYTRANAGEVTGGFSKAEILKPAKDDPRGETGVFARVSALLHDLGDER